MLTETRTIAVERYTPALAGAWDAAVAAARNGVFLFRRTYMDYHADRFRDHSLVVRRGGEIVAVLPANESERELVSHGGLTFGSLVALPALTTALALTAFEEIITYLREHGFERWVYKCVPFIYHRSPAEEDRYALFRLGARRFRCDASTTIELDRPLPFQERRRRGIKKALAAGLEARPTDDFAAFWPVLADNLARAHGARPVHTLAEIERLRRAFPDNIKLFAAYRGAELLAGVVIYEHPDVAHAQYISASEEGKRLGALDAVFDSLIREHYRGKRYFDFGISTEAGGTVLNEGLIAQKEGFGARAVVHDFYELDLTRPAGEGTPCR